MRWSFGTLPAVSLSRPLLTKAICQLPSISHARFTAILDDIGVPRSTPLPDVGLTKAKDAAARAALVPDGDVDVTARRFIARVRQEGLFREVAFELEEALWKAEASPAAVPRRFRRELAQELDQQQIPIFLQATSLLAGLDALCLIEPHAFASEVFGSCFPMDRNRRGLITRHIIQNNDNGWSAFFDLVGADEISDRRFALLMELLVGPHVRPDVKEQRDLVAVANSVLLGCGVELRESGDEGGYPCFTMVAKGLPSGRVKNLIFASQNKPDIVLRNALTNDIAVVTNPDEVLIYDRPIGREGLRWCDLQSWWTELRNIDDETAAKKTLYERLRSALPPRSPPQLLLYTEYYKWLGAAAPDMPALLPEVWFHYDPLTARQRGFSALLRQRMDFLLLLPGDGRVVLEVDGVHHYADPSGRASPAAYAQMAEADRDLRLSGYEIYRFGGKELTKDKDHDLAQRPHHLLREFFQRLFKRHGISIPKAAG